jgi:hypothetical protein
MAAAKKEAEEVKVGNLYDKAEYPVILPLTDELQDDVTVIVNGYAYRIQRGVEVTVPAHVYEVLMNSQRMDNLSLQRRKALEAKKKNDMDAVFG